MRYTINNILIFFCGLLILATIPGPVRGQHQQANHQHEPPKAPEHQSGPNPLVEEMVTLDAAYRDVVSAVALGNSAGVHRALEAMHGTMEKTHEGVRAGTVTIPRNASRIKDFVKMDKAFHEKLEAHDRAALRSNQKEMLRTTKLLLDGCVQCHQMFRK
jgi:hypothetical protein